MISGAVAQKRAEPRKTLSVPEGRRPSAHQAAKPRSFLIRQVSILATHPTRRWPLFAKLHPRLIELRLRASESAYPRFASRRVTAATHLLTAHRSDRPASVQSQRARLPRD